MGSDFLNLNKISKSWLLWSLAALVVFATAVDFIETRFRPLLLLAVALGSLETIWRSLKSLAKGKITIDVFNSFALVVAFATAEIKSAAFIVLMLTFAEILDRYTESRAHSAVEELLKLKPETAFKVLDSSVVECATHDIQKGDILLVKTGARIPADGVVVFGHAFVNESPVTGESMPVLKMVGDNVIGGTVNENGIVKIRATRVGKDSTLERMAVLIKEASLHKSRSEKLADKFAAVFLPIVFMAGVVVYAITRDIIMTAALFLVACADDMAVAIPLAVTASLGQAARRGILIKGGEYLDVLSRVKTIVFDKTGTLTYGSFALKDVDIEIDVSEEEFWKLLAVAEKFSEHPVGRAIFKEAIKHVKDVPDPEEIKICRGNGIIAQACGREVVVGDEGIVAQLGAKISDQTREKLELKRRTYGGTTVLCFFDRRFAGFVTVADVPREEGRESIEKLRKLGVERILMLTGDNKQTAEAIARALDIKEFQHSLSPEDKIRALEKLEKDGPVAMVGDGINDAPALALADVGIAMGGTGTAVAVEAADAVILSDNLAKLPEMILLGRKTISIVKSDMAIWFFTNIFGFGLVLTGIAGPALAAFYNFATDFLPLINSARLFKKEPLPI